VAGGSRARDNRAVTRTRALLSWLVLLVIGFTNGTVRQLGYARFFSERTAQQISGATFVVLVGLAVLLLTRRWRLASPGHAWRVGALWLVLTFAFETGMGVAAGHPWSRILGAYALWEGQLWPLLLVFVAVSPRLAYAVHSAGTRA
jgi:hypothetical protein